MKILAIGAHPDDIEIGCAGALARYADAGHEVSMLVMTDGGRGGNESVRRDEQAQAAEILGAKRVLWGGYTDTELSSELNGMIRKIEVLLAELDTDLVFVNHAHDTHQDHRALCQATLSATRYAHNVLFYEVPTTVDFAPSVYVDVEASLERKTRALLAHRSQVMKTNIEGTSLVQMTTATAVFRGVQARVRHAEGFVPLRLFLDP